MHAIAKRCDCQRTLTVYMRVFAAQHESSPWITPMMGGKGTSPKACMQMTWKACPAGRRGTGTVHMLTASAHELPPLSTALTCSDLCSSEAECTLCLPCAANTQHKPALRHRQLWVYRYRMTITQHLSAGMAVGLIQASQRLAAGGRLT